ncbi:magnesium chelatase subunit D [Thiorhodovibrio frisius]|uniref:Mg-chelatase subunit ChlD n=1 Tax=Thiorhodovibrio frisius TaxID=631362 RepID=H8YWU4_9GAMM|nr:magnesium chelatase subunit D [Thiorhodovibrio frisius]EIC22920.1 Mg-chelatase subunit ChlD [Thiorhodovibrio frisius]WPL22821.1 magnesium-chelatase 60 kDa subunit [Thiorhodovibrio frisius]
MMPAARSESGAPAAQHPPEPAPAQRPDLWQDACMAAALFAVDPAGVAGLSVRALPGPVRDLWLEMLREFLPPETPLRRIPLHIADGRLLGGLDLSATLRAGRPIAERGLLAEVDGGVVLLAMAERVARSTAAHLSAVLDAGEILLERDGLTARTPTRFGVVALDEGADDDERLPNTLIDRFSLLIDLNPLSWRDVQTLPPDVELADILAARARLPKVRVDDDALDALCGTALALGVDSLRPTLAAVRVARVAAALAGREQLAPEDISLAARLVLAPRATRLPMPEQPEDEMPEEPPPPEENQDDSEQDKSPEQEIDKPLEDQVLESAEAAIPADLLAQLQLGALRARSRTSGKSGATQSGSLRGRPAGTRRGEPSATARLNVIETLRAAAPWQRIRRTEREQESQQQKGAQSASVAKQSGRKSRSRKPLEAPRPRVEVRLDDFRVTRYKHRSETTTIFVVDASGSAALHRLAEAKGAIELLLADCYVRRDRVAMIAFRGAMAELLLPPTRSLVRAKRSLAGLPGGGGTPLAMAIETAVDLADSIQRRGGTPVVVFLTDGRANVARDGTGGRAQAGEDAMNAARLFRTAELTAVVIDVSPRPRTEAEQLAREMAAVYLPLPHADASALSNAVKAVV